MKSDELIELTKEDEIVKEYNETLEEVWNDDEIPAYISKEQVRKEFAINCVKQGIDLDCISDVTGLSIEQLQQLAY